MSQYGTGPTVDPVASRVRCLVALARIGVEPLSGRDYWPQGQPRTQAYSSSPGIAIPSRPGLLGG